MTMPVQAMIKLERLQKLARINFKIIMSTKELIEAKIATMNEAQLVALYPIVERIAQTEKPAENLGTLEKLRRIKIDAPADFATNLDLYASGEKTTIYGQLQKLLDAPIEVAPDLWDRRYNVDFAIAVGAFFIGLQIKPMSFYNANEFYKWRDVQATSHAKFERKFGGAVFTIVSVKEGAQKIIANVEVVAQIQAEIARLRAISSA